MMKSADWRGMADPDRPFLPIPLPGGRAWRDNSRSSATHVRLARAAYACLAGPAWPNWAGEAGRRSGHLCRVKDLTLATHHMDTY